MIPQKMQQQQGDDNNEKYEKNPQAPQVVYREEKLSLAPIHACNILFEAVLLFLCSGDSPKLGQFVCGNAFALGNGAIVSMVVLLNGAATETSLIALQAVAWYHFSSLMMHFRRAVAIGSGVAFFSRDWISIVTLADLVLFLVPMLVLLEKKLLLVDTIIGITAGGIFLATHGSMYQEFMLRAVLKAVPVLLIARRVFTLSSRDSFTTWVAGSLVLCAVADFAIEYSFLAGLVVFLLGHLCYLYAFIIQNKTIAIIKALPFFAYGVVIYSLLFPNLGPLRIPVAIYVITISAMLWRATVLSHGNSWGIYIAFGAISFALSDSLIAIDKFVDTIPNVRYPILGLYWLAQGLIAQGVILRLEKIRVENSTKGE